MDRYPLVLEAVFKDYLWGGDKLKREWGKLSELDVIAESWELSLFPDALSRVTNGAFAGQTLLEVLEFHSDFAGAKCRSFSKFPTLIKLIDSRDNLSVQVHPSDAYALINENSFGKTEVWYILEAEEGAGLYLGFNKNTDRNEVAERIANNTLTEILNFVPVTAGEAYFVSAGTVHAIGRGITLAEIQQNSNLTYRVYDFGRVGKDGKPRELHVEKALRVMNYKKKTAFAAAYPYVDFGGYKKKVVADDKYFYTEAYSTDGTCPLFNRDSFLCITSIGGAAELLYDGGKVSFSKGQSVFLPAEFEVTVEGKTEFLATMLR
ncbi:MAG: class I mannose-6-phosphate isomerase [Clostridiales bacterium]|nr:class I mannose-6-phosphate isomerase [Clostridiales bacterium]